MADETRPRRTALNVVARPRELTMVRVRPLAHTALVLPPLALLGVAALLAIRGGGIAPEEWAPAAEGTALGLAALAAVGAVTRIPRSAWAALLALGAFVGWSALSLAWSQAPDATVDDVARIALLALAMLVGASYASRVPAAMALAAAVAVAGAALAILVEAKVLISTTNVFTGSRLAWPIDYANGTAALLWLPLPALLAGAATKQIRPLGRALVGGAAALALADGLMTLSRGGAIALAATLGVCVLLAPERARFALTLAAVLAPVALLSARLTAGQPGEAASDATSRGYAAAIATVAAAVLVGGLAAVESLSPFRARRIAGAVTVAVWTAIAVVAIAAFAVRYGRPDTWLGDRWQEFRNLHAVHPGNASRFGTAASNRYDYWRVAARTTETHPLAGIGAGAFATPWYRRRALDENITDPHSWEAGALAETGVVGFVLLGAALVLPFVPLARARHRLGTYATVALGGGAAYLVLHASLDWLLRMSAVAVPGFLLLGACAAAGGTQGLELAPGRQRTILAVAGLTGALCAVPVYFATTLTARAEAQSATSTRQALDTLSLAADLNPWAVELLTVRSMILLEDGRAREAVLAAREATSRGPNDWKAWLALRDAERVAGRRAAAAAALARARHLNPRLSNTLASEAHG
jgi:O-Antigen ligase